MKPPLPPITALDGLIMMAPLLVGVVILGVIWACVHWLDQKEKRK